MKLQRIVLIGRKEIRDLLRDRRTLIMLFLVPVILYPIIGSSSYFFARSLLNSETRLAVKGMKELQRESRWPGLIAGDRLIIYQASDQADLADQPDQGIVLEEVTSREQFTERFAAYLEIPNDFWTKLEKHEKPEIRIIHRDGDEKSKLTVRRLARNLRAWEAEVRKRRFQDQGLPEDFSVQIKLKDSLTDQPATKRGAEEFRDLFVRVFPFLLLMWVIVGVFQPAVDLTAGEKERGTMETLLISPAARFEIVAGKFLAITLFGFTSVIWNVCCLGSATWALQMIVGHNLLYIPGLLGSVAVGLLLTMFFAALALAVGIIARSTKEGQYYLVPIMLVSMPLAFWTMMPTAELSPATSFIPLAGPLLVQQKILSPVTSEIPWPEIMIVVLVLMFSTLLMMFLTVIQFKRETVLFRELGSSKEK